jgi:hypothetical protein
LQGAGVVAVVGQREAAGVAQHVRVDLERHPASAPARSIIRANPAVVNGPARSLVNTNGDVGACSRCKRRSARNSSSRIGWVARGAALDPSDVQGGGETRTCYSAYFGPTANIARCRRRAHKPTIK